MKLTGADSFDLERFVSAPAAAFPAVPAELQAGRRPTHWMWFFLEAQTSRLSDAVTAVADDFGTGDLCLEHFAASKMRSSGSPMGRGACGLQQASDAMVRRRPLGRP